MNKLPFWKVESVGNDFPLIKLDDVAALATAQAKSPDFLLAELAVLMADRHFGIGGDGLLAAVMEEGDVRLRMFNPDGTEDFCGNGLRCAALWAHQQCWVGTRFNIRHLDEIVPAVIQPDGTVGTIIGAATYDPDKVPVLKGPYIDTNVWEGIDGGMAMHFDGSVLSTGSTHTVIHTYALPDDESFNSVSPRIENDPKFPNRTSVIWTREVEPMHLQIRIWERGVGETQGCGTGASAAAADYLRRKRTGGTVTVDSPGGTLKISMDRFDAPITVEGVPKTVYQGDYLYQATPAIP